MVVHTDEIIILHHTLFSEKSVVLHTLSSTFGRRGFIVKNASRTMPYFQPLNILRCDITENPKSSLWSAGAFSESCPIMGIRTSMGKNAISMFMAEVLLRATREGNDEPGLYEWCREEILLLNAMDSDYSNFHVRFLLDFASAMGFRPSHETLLPFLEEYAALALEFLSSDFAGSMLIKMTGAQRGNLCARLLKFLEYYLESRLNIRSLAVLGELF